MKLIKKTNYEVQLIWIRTQGRPIRRIPNWQLSGLAVVFAAVALVVVVVVDDDDDNDRDIVSGVDGMMG
jgi:hypothetical protein